jgi:hypothetical protein
MPKGAIPPTLNQLRGNKNVKSVEELEADIKQMVGICQEDDSQGSVTQQRYLSGVPQGLEKQYNEDYLDIKNCKEDDNVQEQNEDMSAFRKFVSTKKFLFFCIDFVLYSCYKTNSIMVFILLKSA